MSGADRIDQARRELEQAQRRLEELDETAREAAEFRDADRAAARRADLERDLDAAKEELRFAKEVDARREAAEIDTTVTDESDVSIDDAPTGVPAPSVNAARDPDAPASSPLAPPPDLRAVFERAPWERPEVPIGPLAGAPPLTAHVVRKDVQPDAAAEREAAEKVARDREIFPSDAELESAGDQRTIQSESEGPLEEFSPSVDPYRAQTPEEFDEQIREAGPFVDPKAAYPEALRVKAGSLFFGFRPKQAQAIDTDPDTDPAPTMTVGPQADSPRKVIVPEAPARDDDWKVRAEMPPMPERQAHPAHGEPARQAHPTHGAPLRQPHPAHGLVKRPVVIAALGLIITVIGTTAVVARPNAQPVPASAEATLATAQDPQAATVAPGVAITPAAVGATLSVIARYQFPVTEGCPAIQGSQRDVTSEGTAVHVVRLGPKVVMNPALGESTRYDFGPMTYPGARCPWSLTLEYERRPLTGAFVLFPPSTTYRWEQTQPTSAPGGGRQVATILIVTNGSR